MKAIVVSIGDELVLGQTVDTNSSWLSRELASVGIAVVEHITVADDSAAIEAAISGAAMRCDLLLINGGLGPTKDDLTREALTRALNAPLELNADWLRRLESFFAQRGRPMPQTNRVQAMIPRGARLLDNTAGTAPGIDADFTGGGTSRSCRIFAMPGVPSEMKLMFQKSVLPHLAQMGAGTDAGTDAGAVILSGTLHTFGVGESTIGEQLGDLMDRRRNPSVGTTVSSGVVSVRINARFAHRDAARAELEQTAGLCRDALGDLIYGSDEQTLASVVADLLTADKVRTVATAESCTGGLLAKMLTDIPGSSGYFQKGWITYSNQAKTELLDVAPQLLAQDGAVSESVVRAMAQTARQKSAADFALAISGIAGPDGGTPAKPVGTVCIALAHAQSVLARTFHFPGDRQTIRDRSAKMALTLLRFHLLGKPAPF
ncbi:MAG: competence/damage-inducible protein A [Tepidisphaeraceae bacterium]